ncbi:MAG: signal peptide peptidase SppA [Armatimonadota bacterium]|nr:signal peptide peptidase SppA [Armatimonadota bacterium]
MRQIVAVVLGVALALVALGGAMLVGGAIGFALGAAGSLRAGLPAPGGERHISGTGPEKVAVVRIVGPIAREDAAGLFGAAASSRHIVALLDRAEHDEAVRAVILEMDTPGGSVVASDEIHQKIQAVRRRNKVVVALMTETAASGGYYIAAATNHIVADPTTVTGSIGVIVALPNIQELSRKIGVRTIVFKSGAYKDLGNPNRPITAEEAAIFQGLVDEAYQRFVHVVARGRRMDPARVRRLADGRIYTGQQAMRLGLVDTLGHFPDALEVVRQRTGLRDPAVVEYGGEGLLRSLLGSSSRQLRVWLSAPASLYPDVRAPFSLQYLMAP